LKEGYIKGDGTKHILPKFFFTHDLQRNGDVEIQKIRACENLTDLFTKSSQGELLSNWFTRLDSAILMIYIE